MRADEWDNMPFVGLDPPNLCSEPQLAEKLQSQRGFSAAYLGALQRHFDTHDGHLSLASILLPLCTRVACYYINNLPTLRWRKSKNFKHLDYTFADSKLRSLASNRANWTNDDPLPYFREYRHRILRNLQRTHDSLRKPNRSWKAALGE